MMGCLLPLASDAQTGNSFSLTTPKILEHKNNPFTL